MSTLILGYLLIGAAVSVGVFAFTSRMSTATDSVALPSNSPTPPIAELHTRTIDEAPTTTANLHEVLLQRSRSERMVKPWLAKLSKVTSGGNRKGRVAELHRLAITAGIGRTWTPQRIATARIISFVIGAVLALASARSRDGLFGWIFALLILIIGARFVDVYLTRKARIRQEEITEELPDVADQISITVQAGLGFEQAIRRTVDSTTGPLSDELAHFLHDVRVGMVRAEAFRNLQDRVDIPDMTSFVRAIAQAERSGVPIADILQIQSDELRERRKQRAEERAMKLPVLMLLPLVTCILPPLLIVLLGPPMLKILNGGLA